ncbi:unnamed protein product [Closterium sp. NIES-53]
MAALPCCRRSRSPAPAPGKHPRRPAEPRRAALPRRTARSRATPPTRAAPPYRVAPPCRAAPPTESHCPARAALAATAVSAATSATAATAATAAMASPTVLTFDAEGRAVDFDVWVDDLQLFLQCDSKDGVSLFDHTSGVSPVVPKYYSGTVIALPFSLQACSASEILWGGA